MQAHDPFAVVAPREQVEAQAIRIDKRFFWQSSLT
jgi:hypothetical protein